MAQGETATPNPFTDYRLDVTFRNGDTAFVVPGYYAADGNAAETGADAGNVWRVHFCPDKTGAWSYAASFKKGKNVAAGGAGASAGHFDGAAGTLDVKATDKAAPDHRAKGRLQYVGKHYLRFAETGDYFLKAGADAPENLLAYADFDNTPNHKGLRKTWAPHVRDWRPGDPSWKGGKGKGLIGALNYLAREKGMNAFSFLTMNITGDDRNVFPYLSDQRPHYTRFDCSKLDQWETVFEHADHLGLYLHFKTQEAENDRLLDGGNLGVERTLYYRELIARFGHHLALNWNLGEENHQTTPQRIAMTEFFWKNDPYRHLVVIHNGKSPADLLGDRSKLTGASVQTNQRDFSRVHRSILGWVQRSRQAGKPWVVACDEPGDASHALITDAEDPTRDNARTNALWGTLMAGGAGVEWYFGYRHPHSDLTCQDWRTRAKMWDQCRVALDFFRKHQIPFPDMTCRNSLASNPQSYCFHKPGEVYVVYLKRGGTTTLDLSAAQGPFEVRWYNPREGGALQAGSVPAVQGGAARSLGNPPSQPDKDWAILVRPADPDRNYPPSINATDDRTLMLPRGADSVTVQLAATIADDGKPGKKLTAAWTKHSGPGRVAFSSPHTPATAVTLTGKGTYVLKLTASDGALTASDTVTLIVEPYSSRVTKAYRATDDAYVEGGRAHNTAQLKVEGRRRIAYLKFDVKGLPAGAKILKAVLKLTESGDTGRGTLRVHRAAHSNWTESKLAQAAAPPPSDKGATWKGAVGASQSIEVDITSLIGAPGPHTLILTLDAGGNDVWFGSDESAREPELTVTAEGPEPRQP